MLLILLIAIIFTSGCATPTSQIRPFLHPNAEINSIPVTILDAPSEIRSAHEAALEALLYLQKKGVKQMKICRVNWIFAPVGIYLVDIIGTGIINGKTFTCFRVAVSDGSNIFSKTYPREDIEGMIAYNHTTQQWYPAPGPKENKKENRWLYKTLLPKSSKLKTLITQFH